MSTKQVQLILTFGLECQLTYVGKRWYYSNAVHVVGRTQLCIDYNWFLQYCAGNLDKYRRLGSHRKCNDLNGHCSCMLHQRTGQKIKTLNLFIEMVQIKVFDNIFGKPYIHIQMVGPLCTVSIRIFQILSCIDGNKCRWCCDHTDTRMRLVRQ